ncbi:ABC transporter permease [Thermoactinomyces vulgaris]|jgi:oligopeptide transport system permease protein|nr:ABC transporter permease [Thermoactinomyces vulgaris]
MVLTLWIIVTATFFLMHSLPGTPLKNEEKLPPLIREQIMETYGLNDPLPVQYVNFMKRLVQGDFGKSLSHDGRSVTEMLLEGFEASAFIGGQALVFGVLVGLLLGVGAALRRGGWLDNVATVIAVGGISIPSFVMAALLSYWVGVKWQILPAALWGSYEHTILPSLALSFTVIAQMSRYVRTEMVEVMDQDYMKTAKAKGLGRQAIVFRHALRNALIPAITVLGPLAVNIITGSLVVETIFAVPGIGLFFVESIQVNDYTLIMGVTIFYSILILATIFLVDILYGVIDPRIRLTGAKE